MKKHFIAFILTLLLIIPLFAGGKNKGTLILSFDQLKSNEGFVIVKLYDTTSKKFPNAKSAIYIKKLSIEENKANVSFANLPYGIYAFTAYHDENNNNRMDSKLIYVPTEGYALSNNLKLSINPPSFEKASFTLDKDLLDIKIQLNYGDTE